MAYESLAAHDVGRRLDTIMATRKRHSPEQIVRKLMAADRLLAEGKDTAAVCRELGMSEATYHRWRNQFGGLKAEDAKRLKDLERENATLKRLLALRGAGKRRAAGHREGKLLGPERRRAAVRHLQRVLGVSERFACRVAGQHRATQRHEPAADTPEDPDAALRGWLRQYAKDHPRRGFRPAYHDARGEGGSSITRRFNAFGVRKVCGCRSGSDANATAPPPHHRR
jgi:putative transposase